MRLYYKLQNVLRHRGVTKTITVELTRAERMREARGKLAEYVCEDLLTLYAGYPKSRVWVGHHRRRYCYHVKNVAGVLLFFETDSAGKTNGLRRSQFITHLATKTADATFLLRLLKKIRVTRNQERARVGAEVRRYHIMKMPKPLMQEGEAYSWVFEKGPLS